VDRPSRFYNPTTASRPQVHQADSPLIVIPHIDVFMDTAHEEEWKMMVETKKIIDPKIKVHSDLVARPRLCGHANRSTIEFEGTI